MYMCIRAYAYNMYMYVYVSVRACAYACLCAMRDWPQISKTMRAVCWSWAGSELNVKCDV
jgi:hypothetical protein